MMEEWRDVAKYEGYYQVSNLGRVRSLDRTHTSYNKRTKLTTSHVKYGKILKPRVKDNQYLYVGLCVNGKSRNKYIHRLVANAFLERNGLPIVNHLDSNRQNNIMSNLEWATYSRNVNHCIDSGRKTDLGIGNPNTTITLEEIEHIKRLRKTSITYREISEITGWSETCVGQICRGTRHSRQNKPQSLEDNL